VSSSLVSGNKESLFRVGPVSSFPMDAGVCARAGERQIAVFRFATGEWYACDNACPHTGDMVLSRGLIGDQKGVPKVACPQHKRTFSLLNGECLSGDNYHVRLYPVEVDGGEVFLRLDDE